MAKHGLSKMKRWLKKIAGGFPKLFKGEIPGVTKEIRKTREEIIKNRILIVQPRIREFRQIPPISSLKEIEFQVFSQWKEDGIIQYLISRIEVPNKVFIEFGVEDYEESNTHFLLINNNWRGLILDRNRKNITHIQKSDLYWRYNLSAKCALITKDNICNLIQEAGIGGDIGILSIDIDGNDYWIWEAIPSTLISPRIVIVEYNSVFGNHNAVTVPYRDDFTRGSAHFSHLYYGASLKALWLLGKHKGYVFIGSNSAGNNAFFVRQDVAQGLPNLRWDQGYVESQFRESRDKNGNLNFINGSARLDLLKDQLIVDIETGETKKILDTLIN
jgi:hypothetical protein